MVIDSSSSVRDLDRLLNRLDVAMRRSSDWIVARMADDGAVLGHADFNGYYRVPWALAVAGRRPEAAAALDWIERHALDADGDLLPGAPQTPWIATQASYPVPQIAIGAWLLERYGLARRLMRTLRRYQDSQTGGAFVERPEARGTGRQNVMNTAQLGITALLTGDLDVAEAGYGWVKRLYEAQPELPDRLFTSTDAGGQLIADVADDADWDYVTDFHRKHQQFFNPGIAAAFLARYAERTGDPEALPMAEAFVALSMNGDSLQFDWRENSQICKLGWGAAAVLDAGGSSIAATIKMAQWFLDAQDADGRWHPSPFLVPDPTDADDMPKTAEHLMEVGMIASALGRYRSRQNAV
jgi:hypothetical protein